MRIIWFINTNNYFLLICGRNYAHYAHLCPIKEDLSSDLCEIYVQSSFRFMFSPFGTGASYSLYRCDGRESRLREVDHHGGPPRRDRCVGLKD